MNSYEKEFKFRLEDFLADKIKELGLCAWLDLCCGEGRALLQACEYFSRSGLQEKIKLTGIDLLEVIQPADEKKPFLSFEAASVVTWQPKMKYDLITCSHGLHYLGDKLKVIAMATACLNDSGLFVAHLDLQNVLIDGLPSAPLMKHLLKKYEIEYNTRSKIIKRQGPVNIDFKLEYLGADDNAGPNYTGQPAVTSHYRSLS